MAMLLLPPPPPPTAAEAMGAAAGATGGETAWPTPDGAAPAAPSDDKSTASLSSDAS
jgi:hypothetical protein